MYTLAMRGLTLITANALISNMITIIEKKIRLKLKVNKYVNLQENMYFTS